MIRENEIFISVIRDPLIFQFVNRAEDPPVRPSNEKRRCFFGIGNCDSKNYCGFVVDEFSKLVHTIRSLTESFSRTSVKISDCRAFSHNEILKQPLLVVSKSDFSHDLKLIDIWKSGVISQS